jgi:protein-S-isoprenylcysteine O-methyltransferase Ste14
VEARRNAMAEEAPPFETREEAEKAYRVMRGAHVASMIGGVAVAVYAATSTSIPWAVPVAGAVVYVLIGLASIAYFRRRRDESIAAIEQRDGRPAP